MPFTAPCVPTGMNAGVSTSPCAVVITPRRAGPSVCVKRNANGGALIDRPIVDRLWSRPQAHRRDALHDHIDRTHASARDRKKFLTKDRVLCLTSKSSHP